MLYEDMDQKTFDWKLWHHNAYQHDAQQRDYYNQTSPHPGKFERERLAVQHAYEASLNGFQHDDFGSVQDNGYYCRVLFDEAPFIVCFLEDNLGFITEITNNEYESAFAYEVEHNNEEDNV